jgi:tetratricopeptide (TPR) repeat protein
MKKDYFTGREKSYIKFKFQLWKKLVDAFTWDEQYGNALKEIENLNQEIGELEAKVPKKAKLLNAQLHITQGEIYRFKWEKYAPLSSKQHYEKALTFLPKTFGLSKGKLIKLGFSKEQKLALVRAYLGLGEIYRYIDEFDLKDHKEAKKYYLEALRIAKLLPADNKELALPLAQIYLGLASLELGEESETKGGQLNSYQRYEYSKKAYEYLEKVDRPPEDVAIEVINTYNDAATKIKPTIDIGGQIFTGDDGRTENQLHANLDFAFGWIDPDWSWLHLTLDNQLDMAPDVTLWSPYLGAKFIPHTDVTIEAKGRLFTTGDSSGELMQFYRQPEIKLVGIVWNDHFTLGISGELEFDGKNKEQRGENFKKLSSLQTSAMFNFAFTEKRGLQGLRLGMEYNNIPFAYEGIFERRHSINFGARYAENLTSWFKLKGSLMGTAYTFDQDYFDSATQSSHIKTEWAMGFEAGLGTEFRLGKHLLLDLSYTYQHSNYPIHMFNAGLGITF